MDYNMKAQLFLAFLAVSGLCSEDSINCKDYKHGDYINIRCSRSLDISYFKNLENHLQVKTLTLTNLTLHSPFYNFYNRSIESIIMDNVQLQFNKKLVLIGLENVLNSLEIRNCREDCLLNIYRPLLVLKTLVFDYAELKEIDRNLKYLASPNSLKYLQISNSKIKKLEPYGLSQFTKLKTLILSNNLLTDIERSMLPLPANDLYHLDLSFNKMTHLESNFFSDMKKLRILRLDNNRIEIKYVNLLSPIWSQLDELWINGNEVWCNCDLFDLLQRKYPNYIESAQCKARTITTVFTFTIAKFASLDFQRNNPLFIDCISKTIHKQLNNEITFPL